MPTCFNNFIMFVILSAYCNTFPFCEILGNFNKRMDNLFTPSRNVLEYRVLRNKICPMYNIYTDIGKGLVYHTAPNQTRQLTLFDLTVVNTACCRNRWTFGATLRSRAVQNSAENVRFTCVMCVCTSPCISLSDERGRSSSRLAPVPPAPAFLLALYNCGLSYLML